MQNNVYILQRGLANQLIILVNAFNQLQKNNNVYVDIESSSASNPFSRKPLTEFIQVLKIPIRNLNKVEI